ncbi:hypothetical protein BC832DRAFT_563210 [Gaertneriomyces semiglobifer]|nr:hypothetical protein BC832DRAFT_563210 [Gaertneriomyces semiglobifer]
MHSRHAKSSPHITSHTNAPRSSRSRLRLRSPSSQLLRRESLLSLSSDTQPAHASSSTAAAFLADFPPLRHAAASDFTSRDHHLLHQKREKLKKGKRRGAIDGIRPDRDEKDEDGKWAELAFKEMTLRVDLLAKTTHVTKVKHEDWTIKLQQNYFKVIFHPENVAADDLRTWRVHYRTLRTPASDGLHFPLPDFSLSNLWKLERRLRFGEPDEGTKWFTPDGRLDIRPLSLAQIVYRPTRPVIEIITPSYRRIHPLTLLPSSSSDDADGDMCTVILSPPTPVRPSIRPAAAPTPYLLIFQLLSVEMHDHPLVTEEMRLAKGVEDRVDAWRTRQGRDWDGRVQALRNEYRMVKERYGLDAVLNSRAPPVLDMGSGAQATFVQRVRHLISLLTQLLQTRSQMREEDEMNRLLEFEIVRNWELVKACRNEQGFASCAFRLEVRAALNPASDVNGNDTDTENDQVSTQHLPFRLIGALNQKFDRANPWT